jgi:hypothetical protein
VRADFGAHEFADGVTDEELVVGEGEVHFCDSSTGGRGGRGARGKVKIESGKSDAGRVGGSEDKTPKSKRDSPLRRLRSE